MNFLLILTVTTILCEKATAAPPNPDIPNKRFQIEDNERSSSSKLPPFATDRENEPNHSPGAFEFDVNAQKARENEGNNPEVVGIAGLGGLRAFGTRAKLRAAVTRAKVRANLHHPLLLQETPGQFLHDSTASGESGNVLLGSAQSDQSSSSSTASQQDHTNSKMPSPSEKPSKRIVTRPIWEYDFSQPLQMTAPHPDNQRLQVSNNQGGELKPPISTLPTHNERERSGDYHGGAENQPDLYEEPGEYYRPELEDQDAVPQVYIHSGEGYQNEEPTFSIPSNWKPPLDSNLYYDEYQQETYEAPFLSILPGNWKNPDDYGAYYKNYDVTPMFYNIPDDVYQGHYGRSADHGPNSQDTIPQQFLGVKQSLRGWENNPKVWRPASEKPTAATERVAHPHFHHGHSHSHALISHILNHGKQSHLTPAPSHATTFAQSDFSKHQSQVSDFDHSQHSSVFSHPQGQLTPHSPSFTGHNSGHESLFSPSGDSSYNSGFSSSHGSHGHQLTINKQHTTVIVPPVTNQGVQIAQVSGTSNAVSQSQNSNKAHGGFLPHTVHDVQSAQVSGSQNSVSQSQNSNQAPFVSRQADPVVGAPFLVFSPKRRKVESGPDDGPVLWRLILRRSVDGNDKNKMNTTFSSHENVLNTLNEEDDKLERMRQRSKNDKDLGFLANMGSDMVEDLRNDFRRSAIGRVKRNLPLVRLMLDPNTQVDVPKTLENMGTVARSSFEDKRAPVYHLRNAMGSTKDAFLSTLKIPPQDFLIPSKYKIVEKDSPNVVQSPNQVDQNQNVGAINPSLFPHTRNRSSILRNDIQPTENIPEEQPQNCRAPEDTNNFEGTYKKVGSMFRESIHSGQETLTNMGDIVHNTRKALATSPRVAPRLITSSLRIPAVQRNPPQLFKDKLVVFTPKVVQAKPETVSAPHYSDSDGDFVSVGSVMDSLAVSNPEAPPVEMRKMVLEPKGLAPLLGRSRQRSKPLFPNLQPRSNLDNSIPRPPLLKALRHGPRQKYLILGDKQQADVPDQSYLETVDALDNAKKAVGAKSLKDFILQMKRGMPNLYKQQLEGARNRFSVNLARRRENMGTVNLSPEPEYLLETRQGPVRLDNFDTLDALDMVVALASNLTNDLRNAMANDNQPEQLDTSTENWQAEEEEIVRFLNDLFRTQREVQPGSMHGSDAEDKIVGAGLPLAQQLLKPFMGRPSRSQLRRFFEENGDSMEASESAEAPNYSPWSHEVIGAINPEMFRKYYGENGDSKESSSGKTPTAAMNSNGPPNYGHVNKNVATDFQGVKVDGADRSDSASNKNESVGISMEMGDALLTPFLGKLVQQEVQVYPEYYGYDESNYYRNAGNNNAANNVMQPSYAASGQAVGTGGKQQRGGQSDDAHGSYNK